MTRDLKTLTQTLFANGYLLEGARAIPGARLFAFRRHDRFGCTLKYLLALPDDKITDALASEVSKLAASSGSLPVLIGEGPTVPEIPSLTADGFLARFGGPVVSLLPLEASYPMRLRQLGFNELPDGLNGAPDKMFEEYVRAGLQFLFGTRVIGYGKERSGESVPDGLALRTGPYVLYDAKASAKGYTIDKSEMRKFIDYVTDFHKRYKESHGAALTFLIVTGTFADSTSSLEERSREMFTATKTTVLSFLNVDGLLEGISVVRDEPSLRQGIDWDALLTRPILTGSSIRTAAGAARRDGLQTKDE